MNKIYAYIIYLIFFTLPEILYLPTQTPDPYKFHLLEPSIKQRILCDFHILLAKINVMNFPNARKHSPEKGYRFVISQKYQLCDTTDIPPIWYNDSVNSAYFGMLGNRIYSTTSEILSKSTRCIYVYKSKFGGNICRYMPDTISIANSQ